MFFSTLKGSHNAPAAKRRTCENDPSDFYGIVRPLQGRIILNAHTAGFTHGYSHGSPPGNGRPDFETHPAINAPRAFENYG